MAASVMVRRRLSCALARVARTLPDLRGKANLGWMIMRYSSLDGEWTFTLRDGARMVMPRASRMTWGAAFRGAYDPEAQALLRSFIAPNSVVLDIGAALGLWTIPLARAAADRGSTLWAFEPLPGNQPWLQRNIAANGLENVRVEACALATARGVAFMKVEQGGSGSGAILDEGEIEVPVRVLDDFAFPGPVSAVKIDVEGYELQVLRGATKLLDRDRPVILGEFSAIWLHDRGENLDEFLEEMQGRDYVIYSSELARARPWMGPRGVTLREHDGADQELLLIPRERAP